MDIELCIGVALWPLLKPVYRINMFLGPTRNIDGRAQYASVCNRDFIWCRGCFPIQTLWLFRAPRPICNGTDLCTMFFILASFLHPSRVHATVSHEEMVVELFILTGKSLESRQCGSMEKEGVCEKPST